MHTLAFSDNPVTLVLSLIAGLVPAILWLMFWLREDNMKPNPRGLIALTFIGGMIAVILVLPIQKFIYTHFQDQNLLIVLWAASEELLKFLAVLLIALRSPEVDAPVDYPIYFMAAALGFAGLENALFLVHPVTFSDATVTFLTGNLRFLGSTLLHATATGMMGLMLGLAFYQSKLVKLGSLAIGFILAVTLHSVFNFFIMQNNGENFLQVFAFLWVVTIMSMLVFEKVRRMSESIYLKDVVITDRTHLPA